jgi:hypothetical protein
MTALKIARDFLGLSIDGDESGAAVSRTAISAFGAAAEPNT